MTVAYRIRKTLGLAGKSAIPLSADIRMISGCKDAQLSEGEEGGGMCTKVFLQTMYAENKNTKRDLTIAELLKEMKKALSDEGCTQIPQLSSSKPIDVRVPFCIVPEGSEGTRRALLIGINYVGQPFELHGCHKDVLRMKKYIMDFHGFKEENVTILMDDGKHESPSKKNILDGYKKLVADSMFGDAVFCHFSGHGSQLEDDDWGEEEDGFDETLVPVDWKTAGQIRDDDLFDVFVRPMPAGVAVTCFMDCCHSGTILDLPYVFKADSESDEMKVSGKGSNGSHAMVILVGLGGLLCALLFRHFYDISVAVSSV